MTTHGPVGCGQYSRAGRRNYYVGMTGINTFGTVNFTSDFQEKDIVFGGDKKLDNIITEIEGLFPLSKGVTIQSECPIDLIGDDIEAVAKKKAKELDKPVVPAEGFNMRLVDGRGQCMRFTNELETAAGIVLAEVDEAEDE